MEFKDVLKKELAVKLKHFGYDEPCNYVWRGEDLEYCYQSGNHSSLAKNSEMSGVGNEDYWVSAPTYEQVKVWFMEKHLMFINVTCEKWLSNFMGEVETESEYSKLPIVYDYFEAFALAIEEAIKLKKASA